MGTRHQPFPITRWSIVVASRDGGDAAASRLAVDELCRIYWQPLYSFARRQGLSAPDAEDATQGFFQFVLEKDLFAAADESLGKLRSFLLTAFTRHIRGEWRQAQAQKRGGGQSTLSIDASQAEESYSLEPVDHETPEAIYERTYALRMIETAVEQLHAEQQAAGKEEAFLLLRPRLDPTAGGDESDKEIAGKLGVGHDAVRQMISRLRKRFREIMRERVAGTLTYPTPMAVEEELAALRRSLAR